MQLDNKLAEQLRIPTVRMEEFDIPYKDALLSTRLYEEFRRTRLFRDKGQLHLTEDTSDLTCPVYFIQREDGVVKVVYAGSGDHPVGFLKEHLDPEIHAEVIECRISNALWVKCRDSETGVLAFIAFHHPDWEVRKGLAIGLLEREYAQANSCRTH